MIIPAPLHRESRPEGFKLTADTRIITDSAGAGAARFLASVLRPATGFALPVIEGGEPGTNIISIALDPALAPEEYTLDTDAAGVHIRAGDTAGVFYAGQSLRQLLPPAIYRRATAEADWDLPGIHLADRPRFSWRGVMLDVARHFLPKHDLLRFIDLVALHKLNRLHLHLTDDQGWRVEIRRYPLLTEIGSRRSESQYGHGPLARGDGRPHGGFYTREDLLEIVAYARERGIIVIPEIDSPGHVQAAITAYPELGVAASDGRAEQLEVWTRWGINTTVLNVEESTVEFFEHVFDELCEIFDSPWIGIGGDEAIKTEWENSPRVAERMRELGVANVEELQSWFLRRLSDHLATHGRRAFGWDEMLEGNNMAPGATVASWRGEYGAIAAAHAGHDVVACPDDRVYLDYRESDSPEEPIPVGIPLSLAEVYEFEPTPAALRGTDLAKFIIGGQANIWSEHMDSASFVDYRVFPRLCALAEVVWSAPEARDFADFSERMIAHRARLDALGVAYRPESGPLPEQTRPGVPGKPTTREARLALQRELAANIALPE
ncbi:beta-N-acetylhexosaminidase [Mycetocola spongiae]|uniref:beta-N-acetylhexosaminidase n=1 Tax=Mycetocola spongiae TaxID=2859226 RepID=UPI001CF3DB15|nr:beta-N-acetylhexosaminidase [Mycetocola spongiae]UCR88697.1 beta-N-acetylhexosaminidase [Mycetocola spongiae]